MLSDLIVVVIMQHKAIVMAALARSVELLALAKHIVPAAEQHHGHTEVPVAQSLLILEDLIEVDLGVVLFIVIIGLVASDYPRGNAGIHMATSSLDADLVQGRLDLLGGLVKADAIILNSIMVCKLHIMIAGLCHLAQGLHRILCHVISDGISLDANFQCHLSRSFLFY